MKVEIKVPSLGESISEATVCNIIKQSGEIVQIDDEVIELETDKVNQILNSPESGKIELNVKVDDAVEVGQVIGFIDTEFKVESNNTESEKRAPEKKEPIASTKDEIPISDKSKFSLSIEEKKPIREERTRMSKLRKLVAERLVNAKNQTAMLTTFNEVNMEKIIDLRVKEKEAFFKKYSVKLGFMSFFIKASILALKKYPDINAYIDLDEIVYRKYYDIGVAVGTEKGLYVPVIRDCDKMNFAEIEKKLKSLSEKARIGQISIEDLKGGGFTITNGGVYGSLLSTPILNPPQSGILGMHAIQKRPIAVNDEVVIKPMMYLALSYDHRIIDGEEAIGFLIEIKNQLEDPTKIFVDL